VPKATSAQQQMTLLFKTHSQNLANLFFLKVKK
jgi:hypothetical protein